MEIEQALGIHDVKGDRRINFDEFKHMFLPNEQWIMENEEILSPYRIIQEGIDKRKSLTLQKRPISDSFDNHDDCDD